MKKIKTFLGLCVVAAVMAIGCLAQAQTSTSNAPTPIIVPPGSPGTPAISSTGLSFTNVSLEVYTGVGYASGANSTTQAKTGLSYDLVNGFGPTLEIANDGGNVIAEMDAFFGYHKRVGSFELIADIGGGYNWDNKGFNAIEAVGINYNLTQIGSTFEYVGTRTELSESFGGKGGASRPTVTPMVIVGVAF